VYTSTVKESAISGSPKRVRMTWNVQTIWYATCTFYETKFMYTVSQKTSPTFLAITRKSIDGFL